MVIMNVCFAILLSGLVLLGLFPSAASADGAQDAGVTIQADSLSYDVPSDTYQATGNVEMHWDAATLFADKASLRQKTGDADAIGRVRLLKDSDTLQSDRLTINFETQQGAAENAEFFFKQKNLRMKSRRLAKTGLADYHLEQGSFTTCDGPSPSWKFTADEIDVTLEEFGTARHVLFYVQDMPLLYLPYMVFPVKRERQSGFLFPHIGNSSKKGFTLDIPYYWVISPSQDLTADLDIQTRRGVGLGLDYRYLGRDNNNGKLNAFGIYDTQESRGRGEVTLQQLQALTPSLTFRSDLQLTSDRNFYRDYGETSGVYNRQFLDSSVSLGWHRQTYLADVEARYADNLDFPNNRATLQQLPTLKFSAIQQRIGSLPLYAALETEFTNFYRSERSRGERLNLNPYVAYYRLLPAGVELTARGGYQVRLYDAMDAGTASGTAGVGLGWADATLATPLERVYEVPGGSLTRLRHTLIPSLGYAFTQDRNQDYLPFFDYEDRPLGKQVVEWSLASYLTGRFTTDDGKPDYRELLYLRLSQGYQLSGSRRDLLYLVADNDDRLTDLHLQMRAAPVKRLTFNLDSRYNTNLGKISTTNIGFDLANEGGNSAGVSYSYARNKLGYLEWKFALSLVKPFVFNYTARYSFDKGDFLESYYAMEYRQQCWSLNFSYRERPAYLTQPRDREFLVSFALSGLGTVGKFKPF
jgi:LPS-assembly protein